MKSACLENPLTPLARELRRVVRLAVPITEDQVLTTGELGGNRTEHVALGTESRRETNIDVDISHAAALGRPEVDDRLLARV